MVSVKWFDNIDNEMRFVVPGVAGKLTKLLCLSSKLVKSKRRLLCDKIETKKQSSTMVNQHSKEETMLENLKRGIPCATKKFADALRTFGLSPIQILMKNACLLSAMADLNTTLVEHQMLVSIAM